MMSIDRWRQTVLVLVSILFMVGRVAAQSQCPDLVEDALDSLDAYCGTLERNQACYGNVALEATPQSGASDFTFEKVGDIADVTDIQSLTLQPMDEVAGTWGVVMMQLQADIPDSIPGQNVTFILFGDVEIENNASDDQTPMQAFTLKTGVSDAGCEEAPESGVMIQTPTGVESVSFNVNGVDMEIGSTVMLQAEPEGDLIVATMEGAAVMEMDGESYPVICGTQMSIPMDEDMRPNGPPPMPIPLEPERMGDMMTHRLPRPLEDIEVISDEKMELLEERMEQGLPPCGVGSLPACEHALREDRNNWADEGSFGPPLDLQERLDPNGTEEPGLLPNGPRSDNSDDENEEGPRTLPNGPRQQNDQQDNSQGNDEAPPADQPPVEQPPVEQPPAPPADQQQDDSQGEVEAPPADQPPPPAEDSAPPPDAPPPDDSGSEG